MKFVKNLRAKNENMWLKFHDPRTKISKHAKWYAIAPLLILVVGFIMMFVPGLNLGLDFTGGSTVQLQRLSESNQADVRSGVSAIMGEHGMRYRLSDEVDSVNHTINLTIVYFSSNATDEDFTAVFTALQGLESTFDVTAYNRGFQSPAASTERILMTIVAVTVALLAILVYMLFRFRVTSGVCAVIGLLHDVVIMIALTAIFQVQINYAFVAALITVVVYSLNNTLVLFDRIREKERRNVTKQTSEMLVDSAIKETFGRTMGTTITTLVPVLALSIIGVPLIREFALPIFFGLVAGSFSTIFVTTSLYVRFENAKKLNKKYKEKLNKQDNLIAAD